MKKYIKIVRKSMPEMLKKKKKKRPCNLFMKLLYAYYMQHISLLFMFDIRIHNGNYITVYKHSCLNLVIYIQSK